MGGWINMEPAPSRDPIGTNRMLPVLLSSSWGSWFGKLTDFFHSVQSSVSRTVYIDRPTTFTDPINVIKGGKFVKSGTGTITFSGPFTAGLFQVFEGFSAGEVTFSDGSIKEVYAEWFGGDIQKALGAYHVLQLISDQYFMDKDVIGTTYLDNAQYHLTYIIRGTGYRSTIYVENFNDDSHVFKLNQTAGGSVIVGYPRSPRLLIEDVHFSASVAPAIGNVGSTDVRLLYFNTAAFHLRRVVLRGFKWGAEGTGYTDSVTLESVRHTWPVTGGWLYKQTSNGDGFVARDVTCGPGLGVGCINLQKNGGATIQSCIGGQYVFTSSYGVTIQGCHFEDGEQENILIYNSQVKIDSNFFWDSTGFIPITIDDTTYGPTTYASWVEISNNKFFVHQFNANTARTYDVDLSLIGTRTKVIFRSNNAGWITHGLWTDEGIGIRVYPESAEITKKMPYFSSDVERRKINDLDYRITPIGQGDVFEIDQPSQPVIGSLNDTTTAAFGSMATGTYYYRVATYNLIGNSMASAEDSVVVAANDSAVYMAINAGSTFCNMRVWRGTAAGVYDRYVDIPIAKGNFSQLYDSGDYFHGIAWITAGVPAIPTSLMYGGTYRDGAKYIFASAAPLGGTWSKGDMAINNSPDLGEISQWHCVTAGPPGTWAAVRQIGLLTSIASTPSYIGQLAATGGHVYVAIATGSAADWKQIDN